jgi:hypothetical protein
MNEAMVERISTATAKMMAAEKRMFGTAITRKACKCGNSKFGPTRKGSTQGTNCPAQCRVKHRVTGALQ